MNKILLALAVFAVAVSVSTGVTVDWMAKWKKMETECKTSTDYKGDGMDLDDKSKEYKCFLNCIGEKLTTMKDGKLQADKMQFLAEKMFGKGEKLDKANINIPKCIAEVKETDKCEAAYKYGQCLDTDSTQEEKRTWVTMIKDMNTKCKASTNYKGDIWDIHGDGSKEYKCFLNCIGEQMKTMNDGKLQPDEMTTILENVLGKGERLDKVKTVIPKCIEKVKETDKCEAAYQYGECFKKEAPEMMFNGDVQ